MSITRLQQARQMYATGQRVAKTLDVSRPGYRGDAAYHSYSSSSVGNNRGTASKSDIGGGAASGPSGDNDRNDDNFKVSLNENPTVSQTLKDSTAPVVDLEAIERNKQAYLTGVGQSQLENLYETGVPTINSPFDLPSAFTLGLNVLKPVRNFTLRKNIDYFKGLNQTKYPKTLQGYKDYMTNRLAGYTDAAGNTSPNYYMDPQGNYISTDGGGDQQSNQQNMVGIETIGGNLIDDATENTTTDDELILRFLGADSTLDPAAAGLANTDELRAMLLERAKNLYTT